MMTLRDRLRFVLRFLPNGIVKEELLDDLESAVKDWLIDGAKGLGKGD